MGGANCAVVGCSACSSRHKGLSFHHFPKKGTNDEWRTALIEKINRSDSSFNPDKAWICSRHFKDFCFKTGKFKLVIIILIFLKRLLLMVYKVQIMEHRILVEEGQSR